jgi:hypothetical protein
LRSEIGGDRFGLTLKRVVRRTDDRRSANRAHGALLDNMRELVEKGLAVVGTRRFTKEDVAAYGEGTLLRS